MTIHTPENEPVARLAARLGVSGHKDVPPDVGFYYEGKWYSMVEIMHAFLDRLE